MQAWWAEEYKNITNLTVQKLLTGSVYTQTHTLLIIINNYITSSSVITIIKTLDYFFMNISIILVQNIWCVRGVYHSKWPVNW